jgi:hypothetical protein
MKGTRKIVAFVMMPPSVILRVASTTTAPTAAAKRKTRVELATTASKPLQRRALISTAWKIQAKQQKTPVEHAVIIVYLILVHVLLTVWKTKAKRRKTPAALARIIQKKARLHAPITAPIIPKQQRKRVGHVTMPNKSTLPLASIIIASKTQAKRRKALAGPVTTIPKQTLQTVSTRIVWKIRTKPPNQRVALAPTLTKIAPRPVWIAVTITAARRKYSMAPVVWIQPTASRNAPKITIVLVIRVHVALAHKLQKIHVALVLPLEQIAKPVAHATMLAKRYKVSAQGPFAPLTPVKQPRILAAPATQPMATPRQVVANAVTLP